jgi:hypothetical protein
MKQSSDRGWWIRYVITAILTLPVVLVYEHFVAEPVSSPAALALTLVVAFGASYVLYRLTGAVLRRLRT